jgi:2'-5' RNA ligase
MEMLRLFVAINLPEELRASLTAAQRHLQRMLAEYPMRWSKPEGFHLTLKFLGDTESDRLDMIAQSLALVAARHTPFELSVGGIGVFPNARRPNVLWIGVHDEKHRLRHLAADVDKAMAQLGWRREKRPFNGHLTLARVKKYAGGKDRRALGETVAMVHGYDALGVLPVRSISVMRSQLKPNGAIYTEVRVVDLQVG